jgi:hypothetical protein
MSDKYQDQPWYIKLWRRRYYLMIPFVALRIYFAAKKQEDNEFPVWFKHAWSIATGLAQGKMNWTVEWAEAEARIRLGLQTEPEVTPGLTFEELFVELDSMVESELIPLPLPEFNKDLKLLYPPGFLVGTNVTAEDGTIVGKVLSTENVSTKGTVAVCKVNDPARAYEAVAKLWKK